LILDGASPCNSLNLLDAKKFSGVFSIKILKFSFFILGKGLQENQQNQFANLALKPFWKDGLVNILAKLKFGLLPDVWTIAKLKFGLLKCRASRKAFPNRINLGTM
jgi:hypothetical protein